MLKTFCFAAGFVLIGFAALALVSARRQYLKKNRIKQRLEKEVQLGTPESAEIKEKLKGVSTFWRLKMIAQEHGIPTE